MISKNSGRRVITRADLKARHAIREQVHVNRRIIPAKVETIEILEKYREARPIHQFCVVGDQGKVLSVEDIEKKRIQELETIGLISTRMDIKSRSIIAHTTPFGKSFISNSS